MANKFPISNYEAGSSKRGMRIGGNIPGINPNLDYTALAKKYSSKKKQYNAKKMMDKVALESLEKKSYENNKAETH
ncbi:MAG: hypothetical protein IIA00_00405 [Proteobacteria bacterium]|nr:hypothetical protein [Pseudomonadota bacterium]